MSAYLNTATVIGEGGIETSVHAALTSTMSGLRESWQGTLTPVSDGDQQVLLNLAQGTLRLVDGSEGAFLVTDAPGAATGLAPLAIVGNGDAPF